MKLTTHAFGPLFIALALALCITSCSKSNSTPSFPGTYYGTIGVGAVGVADTVVITNGTTSSSVIMLSKTGNGSVYTIYGTVSGTDLTIASTPFLYNGNTDTASGTGTLTNSTLSINYHFTGGTTTNNYTFTGTKQ